MAAALDSVKPVSPRMRLHEYYELCKPRVVMLIVFTAIVGMFLAVPGLPPWSALVWGTLGIGLGTLPRLATSWDAWRLRPRVLVDVVDHAAGAEVGRRGSRYKPARSSSRHALTLSNSVRQPST